MISKGRWDWDRIYGVHCSSKWWMDRIIPRELGGILDMERNIVQVRFYLWQFRRHVNSNILGELSIDCFICECGTVLDPSTRRRRSLLEFYITHITRWMTSKGAYCDLSNDYERMTDMGKIYIVLRYCQLCSLTSSPSAAQWWSRLILP